MLNLIVLDCLVLIANVEARVDNDLSDVADIAALKLALAIRDNLLHLLDLLLAVQLDLVAGCGVTLDERHVDIQIRGKHISGELCGVTHM